MNDWLSSTWEANWRSFQYFNLYRLIVAALLVMTAIFSRDWLLPFHPGVPSLFDWVGLPYMLAIAAGTFFSVKWQQRFNAQLSLQVMLDVLAVTILMYAAGGVSSGLGILLLISLAAASLVGHGHLVLFYAALATLAVLFMQIYSVLVLDLTIASVVQAGFLSAGFFATAILARLLGQRIMTNEELARRRGVALLNQTRISQRVIERMQDGVLVAEREGGISRHNPVAEAMLGSEALVSGRLDDYSPLLASAYAAWLRGRGNDTVDFSAPVQRQIRARFEPTDSSDGEVLIFLEDLGRIQERAQQLKLAALGRLTASIAHEIRNPLAAIRHAADLLREERREEIQARLLRIVNDNVVRLDRIVQDILDLGRSDRVQLENLSLDRFVRDFALEFGAAEGLDAAVLAVEVAEPVNICFDRSHLYQVLWNLVENAWRHSRKAAGSVRLRVQVRKGEPPIVELHVIDDGPGVPAEIGTQIFEPFFTTHHKGTGLGLFIARELCEANGASLELALAAPCGHFILAGRNDTCRPQELIAVPAAT